MLLVLPGSSSSRLQFGVWSSCRSVPPRVANTAKSVLPRCILPGNSAAVTRSARVGVVLGVEPWGRAGVGSLGCCVSVGRSRWLSRPGSGEDGAKASAVGQLLFPACVLTPAVSS